MVLSLLDEPLLEASGYDPPSPRVRAAAEAMLRLRARVVRGLPPRRRAFSAERLRWVRSYPNGYVIDRLGPTQAPHGSRVRSDSGSVSRHGHRP